MFSKIRNVFLVFVLVAVVGVVRRFDYARHVVVA